MTGPNDDKTDMNAAGTDNPSDHSDRPRRQMSDAQFEQLLGEALRVDVPEPGQRHAPTVPARRPSVLRFAAIAAGVVLAVGVIVNQLWTYGYIASGDIVDDVIVHINHEPAALIEPAAPVSRERFGGVMQAAGVSMSRFDASVTYVELCPFRGEMVAHFALQGSAGPVTVMLLPNEHVDGPVAVDEDGFHGTIAPLSIGGSIAVVGEPGEDIQDIQNRVADAVRWRL